MTTAAIARPAVRNTPPFRADHVGSFLRPQRLLDARARHKAGTLTAEELRAVEDAAIRDIVRYQEDLGYRGIYMPQITNGDAATGSASPYYINNNFIHEVRGTLRYRFN